MPRRIALGALAALIVLTPLDSTAQERLEQPVQSTSNGAVVLASGITAAAGSAAGLWLGAMASYPAALNDGNVGAFYASVLVGTTLGAALGASMLNDDLTGSLVGSLAGIALGYAVAYTVERGVESESGGLVTFALTHGLMTALIAEIW